MKKSLWMLGVAVAALTSCTQSEVVDVPESKLIRFEPFVEKNSRVADNLYDVTTAKLNNFWVYGYTTSDVTGTGEQDSPYEGDFSTSVPVFSNMEVTKTGNSWDGESSDHWITGNLYRFAAYSNGNEELSGVTYVPSTDKLTISDYEVIDADEVDLGTDGDYGTNDDVKVPLDLVASIAGDRHSTTGAQPVQFTFRHLLAKITFHFTNASNNADLTFNEIQINDIAKSGDCVCTYPGTYALETVYPYPKNVDWDIDGVTLDDFSFGDVNIEFNPSATTSDEVTFYVIPQSNAGKYVTMSLVEKIGGNSYNTEPLNFLLATDTHFSSVADDKVINEWVAGYHYRYLITKGTEFKDIQFSAVVSEWNKDRNGDGNPGENTDNVPLT